MNYLLTFVIVALAAISVNSVAVSTSLAGGASSITAGTCATQYLETNLQAYSNSSIYFYITIPSSSVGPACGSFNGSVVQGPSQGPSILFLYNGCSYISSPNYCYGFANSGTQTSGFVATFLYQLTITCATSCPPTSNIPVQVKSLQYPEQAQLFEYKNPVVVEQTDQSGGAVTIIPSLMLVVIAILAALL